MILLKVIKNINTSTDILYYKQNEKYQLANNIAVKMYTSIDSMQHFSKKKYFQYE